jgi:CheY-like chemotaxis protein
VKKAVILVVEDEVIIRTGAAQMLEDGGYAVVEAGGAKLEAESKIYKATGKVQNAIGDLKDAARSN